MSKKATALAAPAPLDQISPVTHYHQPLIVAVFDQIEKDLGGRSQLLATLAAAPDDAPTTKLLGLLADPSSDRVSLGQLMKAGGITLAQLLNAMRQAGFTRIFMRTMATLQEKAPAVVDDVLTRAAPHYLPCPTCKGVRTVAPVDPKTGRPNVDAAPVPCEACNGTGTTLVLPDVERQKLALDLASLLQKKPQVVIDQRKQLGNGTVGALTDLIRATDDLLKTTAPARQTSSRSPAGDLHDGRDIIDGAVVSSVPNDGGDGADPQSD